MQVYFQSNFKSKSFDATQEAVWILMRGLKPTPAIGMSLGDHGCLQHPEPKCFHVPVRPNFQRRPMRSFPTRDCFKIPTEPPAGLLPLTGVGSVLAARCGDARTAPP